MGGQDELKGPDLRLGVPEGDVPVDGMLLGHAGGEAVLLARDGGEIFAIGAACSHYHGPLAEGIVADGTVRCPWHHACFDLRTGETVRPPALQPVGSWAVERRDGKVFVQDKRAEGAPARTPARPPASVVILGGGAVGAVAAATLRREGYKGPITLVSADDSTPYDRPNASKDYLAGKAPEEWMPLFPEEFYREAGIELLLKTRVASIDPKGKRLLLDGGRELAYDALLIATGADPIRLPIPGMDRPHVHTLRTLADSRHIIAAAAGAKRAVVIGASFIGLEVAASLRERDIAVTVVAPEPVPLEKVVGPQLGGFVRALHEEHGVVFRLGTKPEAIEENTVRITGGETLPADLVVVGVGVRPSTALAEAAGLTVDRGIVVDARLRTSDPNVFAAGNVARYPDPLTGERIRVEHWVVAERQAQLAARNILGADQALDIVPFFWSQHYDVPIAYVGHAESWQEARVHGDVAGRDCRVELVQDGKVVAVATIYRDVESLNFELEMERQIQARGGAR